MKNIAHKLEDGATVMMALKALDYLYQEEKRDYQSSNYLEIIKNIENDLEYRKFMIERPRNLSDAVLLSFSKLDELQVRFMARLAGYLTTIRQLEENLGFIFKSWNSHGVYEVVTIDGLIKKMGEEVKNYYVWRDKVFGHLERRDKKKIQQEARLQYGGHIIDTSKEECLSLRPDPELEKFSQLDIVTQHEKLLEHYDNWEKLFINYYLNY